MASTLNLIMYEWTNTTEEELTVLIKDWLKAIGRTQSDLGKALKSASSRMPALIEILKSEYRAGGMPYVASKLCEIETKWSTSSPFPEKEEEKLLVVNSDPFSQLDFILQELRDKSEE